MVILKAMKGDDATRTIRTLHVLAVVAILQELCVGNIGWRQIISMAGVGLIVLVVNMLSVLRQKSNAA
jgi:hypothetical protein